MNTVHPNQLKRIRAQVGDVLVLTKAIRIGLYTTAQNVAQRMRLRTKRHCGDVASESIRDEGCKSERRHAQTDGTVWSPGSFEGDVRRGGVSAVAAQVPYSHVHANFSMGHVPGGTRRNLTMLDGVLDGNEDAALMLADPQTSGGRFRR